MHTPIVRHIRESQSRYWYARVTPREWARLKQHEPLGTNWIGVHINNIKGQLDSVVLIATAKPVDGPWSRVPGCLLDAEQASNTASLWLRFRRPDEVEVSRGWRRYIGSDGAQQVPTLAQPEPVRELAGVAEG
jgi:hypothetical protein